MAFRIAEARRELQSFDLKKLFIEQMGWDNPDADITIRLNGQGLKLKAIAQKRGLGAYVVPPIEGKIPDYATRRRIEAEVRKIKQEHILIFTSADGTTLRWQWVRREPNKPTTAREYEYTRGQTGEALLQRLEKMYFSLEDEEKLSGITDATSRVRSAFDVERVTRRFYDRFKEEHADFMKFVKGIPDKELQRWYASVTLNRLMFVYFIQSKHFLDDDPNYLKNHLAASKEKGENLFYSDFLCPLFFEGFAKKERTAKVKRLFGNIPYLNGGIFEQHEIEEQFGEKIQIPDKAFDELFEFFGEWHWHLDDRPNRNDREINPDVLGYIFEKYINQKQMGAYYTKEDITEYISKNTIIPHLFDVAQRECGIAFDPTPGPSPTGGWELGGTVWRHLQDDPDRYIYPAVRYGVEHPLPDEIAAGVDNPKRREAWNKSAPKEFALPTEIWREVVARRRRYQELREKLANGEVRSINDLLTLNLDIRQFAQDVIEDSDADLLGAFWKAITQIKILDPTVGSGAFLFAALNILEPLYEACIERMSVLVQELDSSGEKHSPKKYEPFRKALEQVRQRPDEDYFIFKSIIINNLYGVDIMEEAVEICKLRLFLKLASQVELDPSKENLGIEPLPDIDFNVRAGNTLVGFVTRGDVERSVKLGMTGGKQKVEAEKLFAMPEEDEQLRRIEEQAAAVDRLYKLFRQQQTEYGGEVNTEDKKALEKKLKALDHELNILLSRQYAIHNLKGEAYKKWLDSHRPFHWFVEFYGIIQNGGFDVIIGNPPYLNLGGFREYELIGYSTTATRNLYSIVLERCQKLNSERGRQGYIVPISSTATEGYLPLQKQILSRQLFISCYDDRPAHLFNDLDKNTLSIILMGSVVKAPSGYSTRLHRWSGDERARLFTSLRYQPLQEPRLTGCIAKIGSPIEESIWNKLWLHDKPLASYYSRYGKYSVFYSRKINSFLQILDFTPQVRDGTGKLRPPSEFKEISFETNMTAKSAYCVLSSSLFRWFVDVTTDGSHLNKREIDNFPFDPIRFQSHQLNILDITKRLSRNLQENSEFRVMKYAHDTLSVQCIIPKYAKCIIDEIDKALADHYLLTNEELDFLINYDFKYRMGTNQEEE
jgi:hypothetical protein